APQVRASLASAQSRLRAGDLPNDVRACIATPCACAVLPGFRAAVRRKKQHPLAHRLAGDALPRRSVQLDLRAVLGAARLVDVAAGRVRLVVHDRPAACLTEGGDKDTLDDLGSRR